MKDSSEKLHRLKSYLYQVMGFFVVEDTILHTTQGLITREILDGWWSMVLTQMVTLLRTACVSVHHGALDCVWGARCNEGVPPSCLCMLWLTTSLYEEVAVRSRVASVGCLLHPYSHCE